MYNYWIHILGNKTMIGFGALEGLTPAETCQRIRETVKGWWPCHADTIERAFQQPDIHEWALSIATAGHPATRAKAIFKALFLSYGFHID
jgi:hypothetical protein